MNRKTIPVTVRINEDLEKRLRSIVAETQRKVPTGVEVTMATMIRAALEQFVENMEIEGNMKVDIWGCVCEDGQKPNECEIYLRAISGVQNIKAVDWGCIYCGEERQVVDCGANHMLYDCPFCGKHIT